MERDLIEKLLTAQVLTLAEIMQARAETKNSHGSRLGDAIREIRQQQADVIRKLLAEPGTAGSPPR